MLLNHVTVIDMKLLLLWRLLTQYVSVGHRDAVACRHNHGMAVLLTCADMIWDSTVDSAVGMLFSRDVTCF